MREYWSTRECERVQDIFNNEILWEFLREWYQLSRKEPAPFIDKQTGKVDFSDNFYFYVRGVFGSPAEKGKFLQFIRKRILTQKGKYQEILELYGEEAVAEILAIFDILTNRLFLSDIEDAKELFRESISDLIEDAKQEPVYQRVLGDKYMYDAIKDTVSSGVFPIGPLGEIFAYITKWTRGHMVTVLDIGGQKHVDELWYKIEDEYIVYYNDARIDTRKKMLAHIHMLEKILKYHQGTLTESMTELEEEYYRQCMSDYKEKEVKNSKTLLKKKFELFVREQIQRLSEQMRQTNSTDHSQLTQWIYDGVRETGVISVHEGEPGSTQEKTKRRGKLTVV